MSALPRCRRLAHAPLVASIALLAALALAACGSARRGEAFGAGPLPDDASFLVGQALFARHCHRCHPHGEGGLGPSLNEKPLFRWAMRSQVRHGFGAMPAFDEPLLSDDELDALVDYLVRWRRLPHEG